MDESHIARACVWKFALKRGRGEERNEEAFTFTAVC